MDPLFQVHKLNNDGQAKAGSIAKAFNELLRKVRNNAAPCRELAIAEMKIEEACFYAKKAIAADPENRYVPATKARKKPAEMSPVLSHGRNSTT
jgi:hypothetical protein